MTVTTTAAVSPGRELLRLLEAIQTATTAICGLPDSPTVAVWLRHRAACYRTIALKHPNDVACPAEFAAAAAELDEARAARIDPDGPRHTT